jgi:hypothetical protein
VAAFTPDGLVDAAEPASYLRRVKPTFFPTPADFRRWLEKHHDKVPELLVGFYKKGTGKPSITWPESVDEALCFGWIDGIRRTIDDESYSIRFTPRRPTSIWSAVNLKRVAELTKLGRMHPAGLRVFEAQRNRPNHFSGLVSNLCIRSYRKSGRPPGGRSREIAASCGLHQSADGERFAQLGVEDPSLCERPDRELIVPGDEHPQGVGAQTLELREQPAHLQLRPVSATALLDDLDRGALDVVRLDDPARDGRSPGSAGGTQAHAPGNQVVPVGTTRRCADEDRIEQVPRTVAERFDQPVNGLLVDLVAYGQKPRIEVDPVDRHDRVRRRAARFAPRWPRRSSGPRRFARCFPARSVYLVSRV